MSFGSRIRKLWKNLSEQLMGPLLGDFKPSQQVDTALCRFVITLLYQYFECRRALKVLTNLECQIKNFAVIFLKNWKSLFIFRRQSQSAVFAQSWPIWISTSSRRRFWLVNAPGPPIGQFTPRFIPSLSFTFRAIFCARISHALSGGFKLFTNHSLPFVKRRLN